MNRLSELRTDMGLNMKEAAQALGMPYTTYVNYEKGVREPNSETLIQLAEFFGVTIDYLLGKADSPRSYRAPAVNFTPEEMVIIKKYRALDPRGQSAVLATLEHEYQAMQASQDNTIPSTG